MEVQPSTKMNTPIMELFFRGILCNWLVCMAFFISGYEHSIANLCTFAIALVLNHPGTISFGGVLHNLIPVTAGNMIGGGVFMAVMYYYVNKPQLDEYDKEH